MVETAALERALLQQIGRGRAKREREADIAQQREHDVHAEPGILDQHMVSIGQLYRHEHWVEEGEKGQRSRQEAQIAHARIVLR